MLAWLTIPALGRDGDDAVMALAAASVATYLGALCVHRRLRPAALGRETWWVVLTALALLATLWRFGRRDDLATWAPDLTLEGPWRVLAPWLFYAFTALLLRSLAPLAVGRLALGRRPADYGWRRGTGWRSLVGYAVAALVMVPVVLWAASRPTFTAYYPVCHGAIVEGQLPLWVLLVYAAAYGTTFLSGESFWRGYLLFGAGRRLGANAVVLAMIPYAIAHLGKPPAEAVASVAAGLLLGWLAWRHRSFFPGVALHLGVALAMDLLALSARGTIVTF